MIVSASRRTDIPALYSDWFFRRLEEGFVLVPNPMNPMQIGRVRLSPEVVEAFVFWSKNPEPMMSRLDRIEGYPYYFQFTLTPYDADLESDLPDKDRIADTFQRLSERLGPRRVLTRIVVWWSVFTSLSGAAANAWQLVVTRFMLGAGEAGGRVGSEH